MQIRVLVDNNTYIDRYYFGEPAFACFIEDGDTTILLDTGYSDVCIRNAELMGLDLGAVSTIALSHGHDDHTRGLSFLCARFPERRFPLVAHPDVFQPREDEGRAVGAPFDHAEMEQRCELHLSREPVRLSEKVTFLGEIPRALDFEPAHSVGMLRIATGQGPDATPNGVPIAASGRAPQNAAQYAPDYVLDDTALACQGSEGLFIITGCSHAGICNIIEHAKAVTGISQVAGVLGGFHLFKNDARVAATVQYFERNNIRQLYPCHCVSFAVKAEIHRSIPVHEVGVGLNITL